VFASGDYPSASERERSGVDDLSEESSGKQPAGFPNLSKAMAPITDLIKRFSDCTLPKGEWTHEAHLIVGAWYVHQYGPADALSELRAGIRRLNEHHGTANTMTNGYHETVTAAYVQVLAAFLASSTHAQLEDHIALLLSGPLADKDLLLRFYSHSLLFSVRARREWVEPDIAPLPRSVDTRPA
jgi:hypothetical protein